MKTVRYHIALAVMLFFCVQVLAQDNDGVVVHSDPRLAMLIKKKHSDLQASSVKITHKTNTPASPRLADAVAVRNVGDPVVRPATTLTAPTGAADKAPVRHWTPIHGGRVVYTGKGYRVQVYSGPDRRKAIDIKMECMHRFPEVRTYISYISPCFRVKVGDFRNRREAENVLHEANTVYHPSMIVPDLITVTSF